MNHLWIYKLYFGFICFGVVFFSSPLQVVPLSYSFNFIFVWVNTWLFWKKEFEFISRHNLGYANYILVFDLFQSILVHFIYLVWFYLFQSNSVHLDLIRSTSVQLGLLCSIQSNLVHLVHFGLFQSIRCYLVNLYLLGPLRSIPFNSIHSVYFSPFGPWWSNMVHLVQFGPFSPLYSIRSNFGPFGPISLCRSIQSIWSISDHFSPIWRNYLRMGKYKFGLKVLSIIWVISIVIIW